MVLLGAHVSASGGVSNAPLNGKNLGCTAIQLFSKNQRQWSAPPLSDDETAAYFTNLKASGIVSVVAHDTYLAVLSIDTYNPIAKKNLGKIKQLASKPKSTYHSRSNNHHIAVSPSFFLADAQKTKSVHLIHVAAGDILQSLCVGEQLHAIKRGFELQIKDTASRYIGTLPDDIGHTLMRLLDQRSACEFYVKDIQDNEIMVFIKYC